MSLFDALREYRLQTKVQVQAAKAQAKAAAREQAQLNREQALLDRQEAREREREQRRAEKQAAKAADKAERRQAKAAERAEIRQAKAADKSERRATEQAAKSDRRATKRAEKRADRLARADRKSEQKALEAKLRQQDRLAEKVLATQRANRLGTKDVIRWVGIVQVVAPVVLPLVYRGVTWTQGQLADRQAQRQGLTGATARSSQLPGQGAALLARIDSARAGVQQVAASGFRRDVGQRLDSLTAAVENAEHMTADQRRRVYQSVSTDLDRVEAEVARADGLR